MIKAILCFFFIGFFGLLVANDYLKAVPNPDKDYMVVNANIHQLREAVYQTAYYVEVKNGEDTERYHLVFSSKIDQSKVNKYSLKDCMVEIEGLVGSRNFEKYIFVTNIKYPKLEK